MSSTNLHKGRTGDLTTDAVDVASAMFVKNAHSYFRLMEVEDERQDWLLHVLTYLHTYDPAKGTISTWVGVAWRTWWSRATESRMERVVYEHRFDSTPGAFDGSGEREGVSTAQVVDALPGAAEPDHESTPLVDELLAMVPERQREALFDVLALGAIPSAAAERHGVSTSSVQKWAARAKALWRERYGVAVEAPKRAKRTDTHCTQGHEFTAENTGWSDGRRYCIPCQSRRRRELTLARRADIAAMRAA